MQKKLLFVVIVVLLLLAASSTGARQVLSLDFSPFLQANNEPGESVLDPNLDEQEENEEEQSPAAEAEEEGLVAEEDVREEGKKEPNFEAVTDIAAEGKKFVADPSDVLVLVNKEWNLTANYVPPDLVTPDIPFSFSEDLPKKLMRQEAAIALEELFKKAEADGIQLAGVSGYRSYQRQKDIFTARAKQRGEEVANKTTAYPGQSEHQTGLAMDVSSASVNYQLLESFGETTEGIWLAENAPDFGFIIRYPKGKEEITGYSYEPWHLRYLGIETALQVSARGITYEEYLANK
jgi:D-alanyl-D-alanine carboxypeptidase